MRLDKIIREKPEPCPMFIARARRNAGGARMRRKYLLPPCGPPFFRKPRKARLQMYASRFALNGHRSPACGYRSRGEKTLPEIRPTPEARQRDPAPASQCTLIVEPDLRLSRPLHGSYRFPSPGRTKTEYTVSSGLFFQAGASEDPARRCRTLRAQKFF